jgi:DNA-binding MarR family transcriptional regulator
MPIRKEVLHIRKLSQQFAYTSLQMHEGIGKQAGFSGTDHKYLGFFLQKGAMTAGELARLAGLTTGAVTGLIDRFEQKKLVKRQFDKEDRRKVIIVPDTEKIASLLKPFYQDFQHKTEKLLASFSADELKTLERYFVEALAIMNDKLTALAAK